ncbi:hypothetical protein ACH0BF_24650 [Pseudobacillus sp. 179-B 2D1 NHS]|uniref:hypothetical protein n=1 Tax=Pseudobacillus sp. 179-B 2D1 NHS TaxID=3374292 RepID=UPI00387A4F62
MDELQQSIKRLYSPGEVALQLNVERQTITKYARLFENAGFVFHKDEKGNRGYTDINVMMFKDLITQRNKPGITLESAAKSVAAIYKEKSITDTVTTFPAENERYNNVIEEKLDMLMLAFQKQQELIENQNKMIQSLQSDIQKQNHYIDNSLKERDKQLLESMKSLQEQKKEQVESIKQLAAAKEENNQRKSFFARLFGK